MKVSIIIPTYNQYPIVEKAIKSALAQSYNNLEVIVSDDFSSDETAIKVMQINDNRLIYKRNNQNIGRVANYRNALFNWATGDYVLLLDGDDYLIDDSFIENAVRRIMEEKTTILFYKANILKQKNDKTYRYNLGIEIEKEIVVSGKDYLIDFKRYGFAHLACLYNRKLAISGNFYDQDISSSDIYSIFKLCTNNLNSKIVISSKEVAVWVKHSSNHSSNLNFKDFLASSWKLFFHFYRINKNFLPPYWVFNNCFKPSAAFILRSLGFKF